MGKKNPSSDQQKALENKPQETAAPDVYSFHTFLFPFTWESKQQKPGKARKKIEQDAAKTRETFEEELQKSGRWISTDWRADCLPQKGTADCLLDADQELRLSYATYQYFNPAARRAILGIEEEDKRVVSNFLFCPEFVRQCRWRQSWASYHIVAPCGDDNEKEYVLPLYAIRLKVYQSGVGILLLEAVNYDYPHEQDVKRINEFGRRIRLPYIPAVSQNDSPEGEKEPKISTGSAAKKIWIEMNGHQQGAVDFEQQVREAAEGKMPDNLFIPDFIWQLLDYGHAEGQDCWETDQKANGDEKKFPIQPVIDDRMFVVCAICNNRVSKRYTSRVLNAAAPLYAYQKRTCLAKCLYALLFIDPKDASCQNAQMLQDILSTAVYGRWADYGTLQAVTHHSMFCITGSYQGCKIVADPFLTEYIEMLTLVLAQRASVIVLQKKASSLASRMQRNFIKRFGVTRTLLRLQRKYVAFQNQMFLFEVTPQEQGIELYQLMRRQLYIQQEQDALEKQIHNLYEVAATQQSARFAFWAAVFALISLLVAVCSLFNLFR